MICVTQVYDVHTVALQSLLKVAGCWSLLCVTGFWLPGWFVFAVTPVLIIPWCGSRNLVKMSLQWWLAAGGLTLMCDVLSGHATSPAHVS